MRVGTVRRSLKQKIVHYLWVTFIFINSFLLRNEDNEPLTTCDRIWSGHGRRTVTSDRKYFSEKVLPLRRPRSPLSPLSQFCHLHLPTQILSVLQSLFRLLWGRPTARVRSHTQDRGEGIVWSGTRHSGLYPGTGTRPWGPPLWSRGQKRPPWQG